MSDSPLDDARKTLTRKVMGLPGVKGTSVGLDGGVPCLKVYANDLPGSIRKKIPSTLGGFRVILESSGPFRAL